MNVIFLDIDGVLNRTPCVPKGHPRIEPLLAQRLARLVLAADASIVLSSTWRNWFYNGWITLRGWECLLGTHGIDCRVIDVVDASLDKISAIEKWLSRHAVDRYVVLDDNDLVGLNRIITDGHEGISEQDIVWAGHILGVDISQYAVVG